MRIGALDVCFWGGLATAAAGLVWAVWMPAGVDTDYFPIIRQQAYGRGPRVLIDEAHWNEHRVRETYRPFARLIERDGYRVARNHQPIVPGLLAGFDVLVVAGARPAPWGGAALDPREIEAVRDWVASGGSLLLVTGSGAAMEPLLEAFGAKLIGPAAEAASPVELARGRGIAEHPAASGREEVNEEVGTVITRGGSSISIPPGGVSLLTSPGSPAGSALAGLCAHGNGRVAIFGDPAILTATLVRESGTVRRVGINSTAGNRQFALNVMHWLTRLL